MNHERLDHGCKAKVLSFTDDEVMLTASWPATKRDEKNFHVVNERAYNTVVVSRAYFERRYGQVL